MKYIEINTSQNVNLRFPIASVANRFLAFFLDWIFKAAYLIVFLILPMQYLSLGRFLSSLDDYSAGAIIILITMPVMFYTLVLESIMEGQTFGKRIANIKVIKIDGYQAKFSDYLIRWFFAIIDIYLSNAAVGIVFLISTKYTQRLGGLASGTAVVDVRENININHTILQEIEAEYRPTFPQVLLLSDNDMQVVKTQYMNAIQNKDFKILKKLATKLKEIMKTENTTLNDRAFVETVIKDYNHYTGRE